MFKNFFTDHDEYFLLRQIIIVGITLLIFFPSVMKSIRDDKANLAFNAEKSKQDNFNNLVNSKNVWKSPLPEKYVALTFDDGPYENSTSMILDILKENNVRATFFVVGMFAEKRPNIVKREAEEGHTVGNHSMWHWSGLHEKDQKYISDEFKKANDIIENITGVRPKYVRPPYGSVSDNLINAAKENDMKVILWSIDTKDWDINTSSSTIVSKILSKVKSGSIIIFHDGRADAVDYSRINTIEALPIIIRELKKQGYYFATIDEIYNSKNHKKVYRGRK